MTLASEQQLTEEHLLKKLQVEKLPSLPHVLVKLLDACAGTQANFQQISRIINQDTAIAARVIFLANSPFYRRGTEINSIERALMVLGTDTVKTIVITASIQQFFSGLTTPHIDFLKGFWKQSLICAHIAKTLALLTSYNDPEEAYLIGILHNVGELVFSSTNADKFLELMTVQTPHASNIERERRAYGIDHARLGALLLKEWKLSQLASEAVEFHHASAEKISDAHHLVKLIYLSSHLSEKLAEPNASEQDLKLHLERLNLGYTLFELNPGLLYEIVSKIQTEVREISKTLDINIDTQDNDHSAQVNLARYVRSIGLVQTVNSHLNQAKTIEELNKAFGTTVELLFGFSHSALFWFSEEQKNLTYKSPTSNTDTPPFKIKFERERSIICDSAIDGEIKNTLLNETKNTAQVIDQQISRELNATGLLCIPIRSHERLFGVLVLGCSELINKKSNLYKLLQYFAKEVGSICQTRFGQLRDDDIQVDGANLQQALQERAHEIAHEANNPLNIINNYLVSLAQKIESIAPDSDEKEAVQDELVILREEVSRTSEIIARLRDLKKDAAKSFGIINLNNEINDLYTLYQHSLFLVHNVKCELDLDPELGEISGNKNELKQVLTNLIKNAAEATVNSGTISISTTANVKMNGDTYAEIIIKDDGPGIPSNVLNELFTPVKSTKGGNHSGLGLSISKNLITDAKGTISCRSNKKGTSFQILLPQSPAKAKEN